MQTVTLARHAMATRFELVLPGTNETALRAAGQEALAEIDRIENQLSLYRPGSEIAQLNARAAHEAVQVSPEVFALLQHATLLSSETEGTFDITIAPLVRCWGFMGDSGKLPTAEEITNARTFIGMDKVRLDSATRTVRFTKPGVLLDLGAIGKGYAIDRCVDILREAGVTSALLHGGTSTAYALGHPPDLEYWRFAIEPRTTGQPSHHEFQLCDESVSVSAIWGRAFETDGKRFGHVIDPRTGQPVETAVLAAVILPSATETDALSTALLTSGVAGQEKISRLRPGMRTLVVNPQVDTAFLPNLS